MMRRERRIYRKNNAGKSEEIVENLKMEKSPEIDKITNEMIKYGGESLAKKITEICNKALYTIKTPKD